MNEDKPNRMLLTRPKKERRLGFWQSSVWAAKVSLVFDLSAETMNPHSACPDQSY